MRDPTHEGLTLAFGTPIITECFDPEVFGDRLDQVEFLIGTIGDHEGAEPFWQNETAVVGVAHRHRVRNLSRWS